MCTDLDISKERIHIHLLSRELCHIKSNPRLDLQAKIVLIFKIFYYLKCLYKKAKIVYLLANSFEFFKCFVVIVQALSRVQLFASP